MSPTKPSVVIVPGSFSPDFFYFDVVNKLREYGYETQVQNLPSASRLPPQQPATMYEDADFFRGVIEELADQGKDVVVVTHSYGGLVGSEAAKGVIKADREAAGKPGGLVKLVFLTSVVPPPGVSLGGQMGDTVPTTLELEVGWSQSCPSWPKKSTNPQVGYWVHASDQIRRGRQRMLLRPAD